MKVKPYTPQQLRAAEMRNIEAAKLRGTSAKIGKTGRMTTQIDEVAWFNAVNQNGGVDASGKTIMDCPEYRRDMAKRHPFTVVAAEDAGSTVGPYLGQAAENFKAIFGEKSHLDGKVTIHAPKE